MHIYFSVFYCIQREVLRAEKQFNDEDSSVGFVLDPKSYKVFNDTYARVYI